jgi:hypothetical protein
MGVSLFMNTVLSDDTNDISHLVGTALRNALVKRASLLQPLLEKNAAMTESDRQRLHGLLSKNVLPSQCLFTNPP